MKIKFIKIVAIIVASLSFGANLPNLIAVVHCTGTERFGGSPEGGNNVNTCDDEGGSCSGSCFLEIVPKGQRCVAGGDSTTCEPPGTMKTVQIQRWDWGCWHPAISSCYCEQDMSQESIYFDRKIAWQECNQ